MRVQVSTPRGPAWVDMALPAEPPASLLVLGHGAAGGVNAPDLVAVRDVGVAAGVAVALVTQPYRVAGRRSPAPAPQLDEAWQAVLAHLDSAGGPAGDVPRIVGGRSSGARVACRTARAVGAAGILALAFPTHPPGRPERSRVDELRTGLPTLVINGDRDPFGVPSPVPGVELLVRTGERHDLRGDPPAMAAQAVAWLRRHGWAR